MYNIYLYTFSCKTLSGITIPCATYSCTTFDYNISSTTFPCTIFSVEHVPLPRFPLLYFLYNVCCTQYVVQCFLVRCFLHNILCTRIPCTNMFSAIFSRTNNTVQHFNCGSIMSIRNSLHLRISVQPFVQQLQLRMLCTG